jgi:hypothetical protein
MSKLPAIEGYHWGWQGPFDRVLYDRDGRLVASVISWCGFGSAEAFIFRPHVGRESWENVDQAYSWIARTLAEQEPLSGGIGRKR